MNLGKGDEKTQKMYTHMNKIKIRKKKAFCVRRRSI
jgi:hypothetical protein